MTHDPLCPLDSECPGRDRPHFIVEGDTWCGGCQIECQCKLKKTHDPLCPNFKGSCCPWMGDCDCQCRCELITQVRADERQRTAT